MRADKVMLVLIHQSSKWYQIKLSIWHDDKPLLQKATDCFREQTSIELRGWIHTRIFVFDGDEEPIN